MKDLYKMAVLASLLFFISSGALAALDDGLVGHWNFDSGSGDTIEDLSGNGRDGTLHGPSWTSGKIGEHALSFDGNDDYAVIDNYYGVGGTQPRTVSFWWKGTDIRDHSWVKWGPANTGEKYYIRAHSENSECYLRVEVEGGQNYGNTNVCDGEWHHLVVVFPDGANSVQDHDLYVDTQLEPKNGGDQSMNTDTSSVEVHMGRPLAHHAYAKGSMDNVRIYDRELSESEIKDLYNYKPSICNSRGTENECIMNEKTQLDAKTYDISSIFISEKSASIESLSGQAILDVSNSTFISGLWHGSFYLNSSNPVLEPGASFKPENQGIIVGR